MPRGDRTGPNGAGPLTGRGEGYCAGYNIPGYANLAGRLSTFCFGRGSGGRGRGFRHWFYATGLPGWIRFGFNAPPYNYSRDDEKTLLKQQVEYLTSTIENINKRLAELEKEE